MGDTEPGAPSFVRSVQLIARFAARARGMLVLSVLLAVVATALELAPLWIVYQLVEDLLAGDASRSSFYALAWASLGAAVGHFVLFALAMAVSHQAAFTILHDLRVETADRLTRLPLGYVASRRTGDFKKLIIDETERLELSLAHGIPDLASALTVWLGVTAWLFVVDWRLAIASIAIAPIAFACLSRAINQSKDRAGPFQRAGARMDASIVEYLAGMPVVKVFNRTGAAFRETSEAVREYTKIETDWARAFIPLGGAFYNLILANIVLILPTGLWLYQTDRISLATLLFFVIVGASYSQPLLKIFNQSIHFSHLATGADLVQQVLSEAEVVDADTPVEFTNYDVEFHDVSFGYADRTVLRNVSFRARTGTATALVGPSGAGKTTIARLVPRFWDVAEGSVRIGGHDVRQIPVQQVMDTVAFVFQDTFLFHDTIAANLRLGRPEASDEDIVVAAQAARCHDFVLALPNGYDTVVGEHGATLSGGEKQRLAIARAIVKDAPIIVLDEATAFADPENEAAIQDALSALAAGKTLIVVAHRMHTIVDVDQILVVDDGRIVEQGRHPELRSGDGRYARLWGDYVEAQQVTLHRGAAAPAGEGTP